MTQTNHTSQDWNTETSEHQLVRVMARSGTFMMMRANVIPLLQSSESGREERPEITIPTNPIRRRGVYSLSFRSLVSHLA